jgi:hypothetical protein
MKNKTVLSVRFRNQSGTLSRPQTIRKVTTEKDDKTTVEYFTMSGKCKLDRESFVFTIKKKGEKSTLTLATTDKVEVIRVKFKNADDSLSRVTRIYKITVGDKTVYRDYKPNYIFSLDINPNKFVTDWEHGPTPTPRPFTKCSDTELLKSGYTEDEFVSLRKRKFSAKDVSNLRKLVGMKNISNDEARATLTECGSVHKAKLKLGFNISEKTGKYTKGENPVIDKVQNIETFAAKVAPGRINKKGFKGFERDLRDVVLFLKKQKVDIPKQASLKDLYALRNTTVAKIKESQVAVEVKHKDWKNPIKGKTNQK